MTQGDLHGKLGAYRLLDKIAEGGMGVVYLARGAGQRTVAVKVLRPTVAGDPVARRRLAREVETMQRVRSPHVAEVIDADLAGDVPYIVTRYVPGRTLDEVVSEQGPLRGGMLARLAGGLAEALAAVHAAGVVHRDVKPGNVMMLRGTPVVIDFGIAQGPEATRLTLTGMFMGTPGYLAPEVIEGQPSTAASDVHAWGATVAFAATGRPPYGTGAYEGIFYRIVNGQPDLAGAPAPLVPLLAAALARHPAHRPSAQQLSVETAILNADELIFDPATAAGGPAAPRAGATVAGAPPSRGPGAEPESSRDGHAPAALAAAAAGPPDSAGVAANASEAAAAGNGSEAAAAGNGSPAWHAGPLAPAAAPAGFSPTVTSPLARGRPLPEDLADVITPVRYAQGRKGTDVARGAAAVPAAGGAHGPQDAGPAPARGRHVLAFASVVLLASVSVIAPIMGTLASLCVLLTLRVTALAHRRSARRRQTQGAGAAESLLAVIAFPWHLLRSAFALVLLAPFAVAAAALAAGATALAVPADWPSRALAVGAGALVGFYGLGPGSGLGRRQLSRVFGELAGTRLARMVVLAGVTVLAVAAVAAAISWPSLYWPAAAPGGTLRIGVIHLGALHRLGFMRGLGLMQRLSLLRHYMLRRLG
jgi:Protein kinase domain